MNDGDRLLHALRVGASHVAAYFEHNGGGPAPFPISLLWASG